MFWLVPTILISCVATFFLGYHFRGLAKKIEHIEEIVKTKVDKKPEVQEVKSELIDVTDPVQEAMWEHKKMMEKLNPNE